MSFTDALRLPPGAVDLAAIDTGATPGFEEDKKTAKEDLAELGEKLAADQEMLFAEGRTGGHRSILLVLQGMDTSGKGGTLRATVGLIDPQGVQITGFKAPTDEELAHDFLWRITKALPGAGSIGVFDRSHYEDVLIARVRGLVPHEEIERRYHAINDWEDEVAASGTTIIKCMLHISPEKQKERLLERLARSDKHWKFNPGDIDERRLWDDYQDAYRIAIERTNTPHAPWHVIPADKKWYRNLAVGHLLHEALKAMDLSWPSADFDVEHERARLLSEESA